MVPRRGLEPPRPCERQHLKLVRLPIPPPGHLGHFGRRRRLEARRPPCQSRNARAIAPAHDRARRRACNGFRRRRIHRPLRLRGLLKSGVRVRIAQRNPRNAYFIQPLAQVGQFGFEQADITNRHSVRHALRGATAVVNLCGVFGRKMRRGPCRWRAQCCRSRARGRGADALVQVSAIGADAHSPNRITAAPRARARRRSARPSRRDDHSPVAGVRPRGRSHQPLRRAWRSCRSFR